MNGFEWIADMKDGMSKPAREGKDALKHLSEEIKKTEAEIRKLQGLQLQAKAHGDKWMASFHGLEASKLRLQLGGLRHEYREAKESSEGFFSQLKAGLVPEIAMGELLGEGIKKLGEWTLEAIKFSVEVAEFKENMVGAYEVLGKNGEEMFASIDKLARNIHMPAEKAHALAQDLLTRGMEGEETIAATVAAIAAAKRGGPSGSAEKLETIIERSLSLGKFQLRSPRELASAGIDVEKFYKDLGSRLGRSRDEIKRELKAGAIDAKVGIAAIDDAINTGKIGEIAKKKLTMSDVQTDLMNNIRSIFQDVDAGPLVRGFRDFVSIFDAGSASGQMMKDTVTFGINDIIKWVGRAEEAFTIWLLEMELFGADAYIDLFPLIDVLFKIEHAIGRVVDKVTEAGGSFDFTKSLVDGALPLPAQLLDLGYSAGRSLIAGVRDATGSHSPSREMMKLGKDMDTGGAMGFSGGHTQDALVASAAPPSVSAGGSSSSGPNVVSVDVGGIHVHATVPEDIIPLVEAQITDVFERVALELGQ